MPSFAEAAKTNASFKVGSYRPVALFVGGTSGVGQAIAERFAHHTNGNAHIIICGRNKDAADKIIQSFPQTPQSRYEFLYCDATLIKNIVAAAAELKSRLNQSGDSLNYLILSQGMLPSNSRTETEEGLDVKMATNFYGRWKFVDELLPLLKKAAESGQESRVMTVLAAGKGVKANLDDLGLKRTYGFSTTLGEVPTYHDLLVNDYAKRHPNMSFTHIYPGFVDTPLITGGSWWKIPFKPLVALLATSPQTCGEWMLSALWSPANKHGGFHLDNHADPVAEKLLYTTDEAQEKVVAHYKASVAI